MTPIDPIVRTILDQLRRPAPRQRADAADSTLDLLHQYTSEEGTLVGRALLAAAQSEPQVEALESMANALAELALAGLLPDDLLRSAARLHDLGDASVSEQLDDLREMAALRPTGVPA